MIGNKSETLVPRPCNASRETVNPGSDGKQKHCPLHLAPKKTNWAVSDWTLLGLLEICSGGFRDWSIFSGFCKRVLDEISSQI